MKEERIKGGGVKSLKKNDGDKGVNKWAATNSYKRYLVTLKLRGEGPGD